MVALTSLYIQTGSSLIPVFENAIHTKVSCAGSNCETIIGVSVTYNKHMACQVRLYSDPVGCIFLFTFNTYDVFSLAYIFQC